MPLGKKPVEQELDAPDEAKIDYLKWGLEIQRTVAESVSGVLLRGARPVPVGITQGATKSVSGSAGAMVGFALTNESEDEAATVRVLFHDGLDANADIIMKISLAPGESTRDWFHPGINLERGLFLDYEGGDISGSVFMRGSE